MSNDLKLVRECVIQLFGEEFSRHRVSKCEASEIEAHLVCLRNNRGSVAGMVCKERTEDEIRKLMEDRIVYGLVNNYDTKNLVFI